MKTFALLVTTLLLPFSSLDAATNNSTTITVRGKIKAEACLIYVANTSSSVEMGTYGSNTFHTPGDVSDRDIPFQISLTRCPLATQSVKVKFEGAAVNGYLALDASSEGRGVGIALYDATRTWLPLSTESMSYPVDPVTGLATLNFFARFVALTVPIEPGPVQATATFTLNYS